MKLNSLINKLKGYPGYINHTLKNTEYQKDNSVDIKKYQFWYEVNGNTNDYEAKILVKNLGKTNEAAYLYRFNYIVEDDVLKDAIKAEMVSWMNTHSEYDIVKIDNIDREYKFVHLSLYKYDSISKDEEIQHGIAFKKGENIIIRILKE